MGLSIHGPGEGEGQILHVFLLWRSYTSLQHLVLVLPWRGEGTGGTTRTWQFLGSQLVPRLKDRLL